MYKKILIVMFLMLATTKIFSKELYFEFEINNYSDVNEVLIQVERCDDQECYSSRPIIPKLYSGGEKLIKCKYDIIESKVVKVEDFNRCIEPYEKNSQIIDISNKNLIKLNSNEINVYGVLFIFYPDNNNFSPKYFRVPSIECEFDICLIPNSDFSFDLIKYRSLDISNVKVNHNKTSFESNGFINYAFDIMLGNNTEFANKIKDVDGIFNPNITIDYEIAFFDRFTGDIIFLDKNSIKYDMKNKRFNILEAFNVYEEIDLNNLSMMIKIIDNDKLFLDDAGLFVFENVIIVKEEI